MDDGHSTGLPVMLCRRWLDHSEYDTSMIISLVCQVICYGWIVYGDGIHLTGAHQREIARRKLSLLELAKELNNVRKACKLTGHYHQQF